MTKVELYYNPYLCTTEIKIDGEGIINTCPLYRYRNTLMQDWVQTFLPELIDYCNDDEISIVFYGLGFNYESLEHQVNIFNDKQRDVCINLQHERSRSSISRMGTLLNIIDEMEKNDIIDKDKITEISANVNNFILEVVMISSDDSLKAQVLKTLLDDNSLKMPQDRGSKIIDCDRNKSFEVTSLKPNEEFDVIKQAIPFANHKHVQLMITDTPNSEKMDDCYYRYIMKSIKEGNKPMIFTLINSEYFLNNEKFLSEISRQYNQKGMQNKERFIFIANEVTLAKKMLLEEYAIKDVDVYGLDNLEILKNRINRYMNEYLMVQKVVEIQRSLRIPLKDKVIFYNQFNDSNRSSKNSIMKYRSMLSLPSLEFNFPNDSDDEFFKSYKKLFLEEMKNNLNILEKELSNDKGKIENNLEKQLNLFFQSVSSSLNSILNLLNSFGQNPSLNIWTELDHLDKKIVDEYVSMARFLENEEKEILEKINFLGEKINILKEIKNRMLNVVEILDNYS